MKLYQGVIVGLSLLFSLIAISIVTVKLLKDRNRFLEYYCIEDIYYLYYNRNKVTSEMGRDTTFGSHSELVDWLGNKSIAQVIAKEHLVDSLIKNLTTVFVQDSGVLLVIANPGDSTDRYYFLKGYHKTSDATMVYFYEE